MDVHYYRDRAIWASEGRPGERRPKGREVASGRIQNYIIDNC